MMTKQELASEFVLKTFVNVFITGKAGTGKTTFLRNIQNNTLKKTVVAAPTGVAAINAGGVTLHSLFQLTFNTYLPTTQHVPANFINEHTLLGNIKFSKPKLDLLREMELLIIDEVSMLRCDTLDCIDTLLRAIRKNKNEAFGGVQLLFIGDLFQLPPVVKDEDWKYMNAYYETPFFFSSEVYKEAQFFNIEFDHIYRQSDEKFIRLLNKVRNNELYEDDFYSLNERYQPEIIPDLEDYITLTTHNYKADKINQAQLQKLDGKIHEFDAEISGEFYESAFPTERTLQLKVGAQIMFIKNDSQPEKKYFNGKLATIKRFEEDGILVQFLDDGEDYLLGTETWDNIRFSYNATNDKIEEERLGSFTQFPIRMAWAITIHKSQGLTFDKAVIDAGQAFAAGQVYVALSRCTSLNGLFLMTRIFAEAIKNDERIIEFTENNLRQETKFAQQLPFYKLEFAKVQLLKSFDLNKLVQHAADLYNIALDKKLPEKESALCLFKSMETEARNLQHTAEKFIIQLQGLLNKIEQPNQQNILQERVEKAIQYFGKEIADKLIQPLQNYLEENQSKKGIKGFLRSVVANKQAIVTKLHQIEKLQFGDTAFYEGTSFYDENLDTLNQKIQQKATKGETHLESLRLYKAGKNIEAIAKERNMATSTIEGHLARFVADNEISIFDFLTKEELNLIEKTKQKLNTIQLTSLKQALGDKFSYGQLRMVIAYLEHQKI